MEIEGNQLIGRYLTILSTSNQKAINYEVQLTIPESNLL